MVVGAWIAAPPSSKHESPLTIEKSIFENFVSTAVNKEKANDLLFSVNCRILVGSVGIGPNNRAGVNTLLKVSGYGWIGTFCDPKKNKRI